MRPRQPNKKHRHPAQRPRPAAPALRTPRGVLRLPRTLSEGPRTGGRGRPGEGRAGLTGSDASPAPAAWPHAGLNGAPSPGRTRAPLGPRGPPGGAALVPETDPRERDAQPATGGRERARPPGGRAWLGLSTSDKPPQTVTFTSWGHAPALTPRDARTPTGQPPQAPSACAVARPRDVPTCAHARCKPAPRHRLRWLCWGEIINVRPLCKPNGGDSLGRHLREGLDK